MIEIFILLFLIFLNALFVLSEIALVSARKIRLESLAEKGDEKAKTALELSQNPEVFLSTAQVGITLIAILTGVYSGERFGVKLQPYVEKIGLLKPYAATISITLVVIIVTLLSIIFGELIPKRIGLLQSERIARIVAGPMKWLSKFTHPLVWLLNIVTNLFFKLFNINTQKDVSVTEDEIKAIISEGTEQGTIEEAEQEIIQRVFHLGDRSITSLMTYRNDIVWFDINDNEEKIREKIIETPHSIYPICEGQIDNLKGVVSIKDLYIAEDYTLFKDLMKPALFVPGNVSAYQVLEKFKESKIHCCYIVDEYGSLLGMITLNDILEAIVGDIPQQNVDDYNITERGDGSFLVDAQIPFYNFLSRFDKADRINQKDQEFNTLAGFILHHLEHIPVTGEKMEWREFTFEIIDMDAQRIDKVLVTVTEDEKEDVEA
jgi:putative hemolysin